MSAPSVWSLWTWRKRAPELHEGQPIWRYWIEQAAILALCGERLHADKRGDQQTVSRITAVLDGGAQWEHRALRRIEFAKSAAKIATQVDALQQAMAGVAEKVQPAMERASDNIIEFSSSSRFHNRIARERRKGMVFVHNEANRVRREMGLPTQVLPVELSVPRWRDR